ncbi:MAG: hypothetical protein ACLFPL_04885 [Candidatus Nanoarchaeia archaeon]
MNKNELDKKNAFEGFEQEVLSREGRFTSDGFIKQLFERSPFLMGEKFEYDTFKNKFLEEFKQWFDKRKCDLLDEIKKKNPEIEGVEFGLYTISLYSQLEILQYIIKTENMKIIEKLNKLNKN